MRDFIYRNRVHVYTLFKYGIAGMSGLVTNIFFMYIFTDLLGVWYIFSAIIAFCAAFVVSFSLQKWWTFGDSSTHSIKRQGFIYLVIALLMLVSNMGLLYILVEFAHLWHLLAQTIALFVLGLISFVLNRFVTFNKRDSLVQDTNLNK